MPQQDIKTLKDFDFENKRVFMRVDFNAPLHNQVIQDSRRIEKALPSIEFIMEQGGKIVLASHLGRPKGRRDLRLSLKPAAEYLSQKKNLEVFFVEDCDSPLTKKLLKGLKKGQVILLENLRFHKGEETLDLNFAKEFSRWTDIYINEAFGISHREHTSISLLPELIEEKGLGLQFEKEIEKLRPILTQELKRPFCVVLGGSKLKDKIPLMESLIDSADEFLIGGLMAYTFLKAKGFDVGQTYVEEPSLNLARNLIERLEGRNKKLFLPYDFKGDFNGGLNTTQDLSRSQSLENSSSNKPNSKLKDSKNLQDRFFNLKETLDNSQGSKDSLLRAENKLNSLQDKDSLLRAENKLNSSQDLEKSQELKENSSEEKFSSWDLEKFPRSAVAYDIGLESLKQFQDRIQKAGSIFWNGPMGFFEKKEYAWGSLGVAQALAENKKAYRVVGGGHSALAVRDFENEIDHISTGGGASLAYLQDKTLIGLKKLYTSKR